MPAGDPKARRPRHALGRTPDALAPARRRQPPVQGAGPGRHLDLGYRSRRRRLPEPDHLLLPHQGGAVRRGRLPRHAVCGARGRAGGAVGAYAAGIHPRAGRERDGDRFGRLLCRSADADAAPPGSRAAGRAHHRAAARRGAARLCRPDRASRLEHAARSRCDLAAVLGGRDRRDGRGLCDGPFGGRIVRAKCCACWASRRRQNPSATARACASSASATHPFRIHPKGRLHHDRASHACPRFPVRGSS